MFQFSKRKASKRKETLDDLMNRIDLYPCLEDFERKSLYKEILTSDLNSNLKKTLVSMYELKSKNFILAQKLIQKEKDEKVEKHQSKTEEQEKHNLQNKVKDEEQTEKEIKSKVAIEKVEGIRRAKVLNRLEKRFLLNDINNKENSIILK